MKFTKKDILRIVEKAMFVIGGILVVSFVLIKMNQVVAQGIAKEKFQANFISQSEQSVDQSLWSEKRINEYAKASLKKSLTDPIAVLDIPALNLEVAVFNGASDDVLDIGVGRVPGTAQIGGSGNLALAAHRDSFFRGLKKIKIGDVIKVRNQDHIDVYNVSKTFVVKPEDISVLAKTQNKTITLITCYPFYFVGSAPERFIVRGELIN